MPARNPVGGGGFNPTLAKQPTGGQGNARSI